jgi:hypothetical protein
MNRARGMIVAGSRAARRMSSRLRGSRGQAAFWRPVTLHWRRIPRPRAASHGNAIPGSWMSIFAPRIVLHFLSNLSAIAQSTLFATTRSVAQPRLIRRGAILLHRETLREHVSREHILSRARERFSTLARVDFLRLAQLHRRVDAPRLAGSAPHVHSTRTFSVTAHSTALNVRVSNRYVHDRHYSAAFFFAAGTPGMHRREHASRTSFHSVEPSRVIHRTELVWRQPQAIAKSDAHAPDSLDQPRRSRVASFDSPRNHESAAKSVSQPATPSFDAAQMDRLVENVIQRVDKRVRIERERRGW